MQGADVQGATDLALHRPENNKAISKRQERTRHNTNKMLQEKNMSVLPVSDAA